MTDFASNPRRPHKRSFHYLDESISDERLAFLDGERLGDLSLKDETPSTCRKVRRIIEKRVAQDFWRNSPTSKRGGARPRFEVRRKLSSGMKHLLRDDLSMRECA